LLPQRWATGLRPAAFQAAKGWLPWSNDANRWMEGSMNRDELLRWLKEEDPETLQGLWDRADRTRSLQVGSVVPLWGLIEVSNYCIQDCLYCSQARKSWGIKRYRMGLPEIIACAVQARSFGYDSVVLRGGTDPCVDSGFIADAIRKIKAATGMAITLNLGARRHDDLLVWRRAGADRYLLRFDTSNRKLFEEIHPTASKGFSERLTLLRKGRKRGYEIGSGLVVGLPGQTWEILAQDLETIFELSPDFIDLTSFRPNPRTPLGVYRPNEGPTPSHNQVPNDEVTTLKVIALARLLCPAAGIRSRISSATVDFCRARARGLQCGANMLWPNLTPSRYRTRFNRQPWSDCSRETAITCHRCMQGHVLNLGRVLNCSATSANCLPSPILLNF
jgi:biotin synthase